MYVPVAAPWIFGFGQMSHEEMIELEKVRAQEINRQYFWHVYCELTKYIKETKLFNILELNSLSTGCSCYLSYKKYPNVWTLFDYSIDNPFPKLSFQCYIHEHKWAKFEVQFTNFLQMVGFMETPIKKVHWFNRIQYALWPRAEGLFKNEHYEPFLTPEKLEWLIEQTIANQQYKLDPYKLHYEQDGITFDLNQEEAEKYLKKDSLYYYNDINDNKIEIKYIKIKPDSIQEKLIYMFTKEYIDFKKENRYETR